MTLNYWKQPLTTVPAEMWTTSGLEALVLADTGLARLSRLLSVDLRGNPLEDWPLAIADLPALEKLDLRWVSLPPAPPWVEALRARGCVVYV
jgi:hypothetical protein